MNWWRNLPEGISDVKTTPDGFSASVSLPTDGEGFVGRECSSCASFFKVKTEDLSPVGDTEPMWCPYCGEERSGREAFQTAAQTARINEAIEAMAEQYVHEALAGFGRDLERMNRPGAPVTFKMNRQPAPPMRTLPEYVEDEVRKTIDCPKCGRQHAVYGASAFCPFCGALPSLDTALDALSRARQMLALEDAVPDELRAEVGAQGVFDALAADAIKNCVTLFETVARERFQSVVGADAIVRAAGGKGVFQRLDDLDQMYAQHVGFAISSLVPHDVWTRTKVSFQQRHVLTHLGGIVDQRFLDAVPGSPLRVGRRLVIARADAAATIDDVEMLIRAVGT